MNYNKQKNNQVYSLVVSCSFFFSFFSFSPIIYLDDGILQMVDSKLRWKEKLNPDFINLISCHTTHVIPIPHTKNTITLAPFTRYPKMFVYGSLSFYLFYLIKKENCQLAVTKLSIVSLLLFLLLSADCFITFYLDSFSMRLVHPLSCFNLLYCREKIQTTSIMPIHQTYKHIIIKWKCAEFYQL